MALYLIGLGLSDEKDISVKGLEAVKKCRKVYLESYTAVLSCPVSRLEEFYGRKIIVAPRDMVEKQADVTILEDAEKADTALLVVGDPLAATTHMDILERAKSRSIKTEVIHNASVMNAIAATGLQLYKFGKTTSMPFPQKSFEPETAYDIIMQNRKNGSHTLVLLDLRPEKNMFITVNEGIKQLLKIELKRNEKVFTEQTKVVGCARIGSKGQQIIYGNAKDLLKIDFGKPMHCLVVPGDLHFMEEEILMKFQV
ncbi:diphthine synthase [Candidatus Woesearchaeota archaeon]|nr:diphthine synthase [Candidatus Woesearchaeota archaeon]